LSIRVNQWNRVAVLLASLALPTVIGCGSSSSSSVTFPSTATITSSGGSVTSGNATLSVPASAVSSPTLISVQATTSYTADSRIVSGTIYTFDANGTTFVQPVTISITYATANLPTGAVTSSLTLFKLVSSVWTQVTNSSVNITTQVVTGTDTTLGTYAILATSTTGTGTTGTTDSNSSALFASHLAAADTTPNLGTVTPNGATIYYRQRPLCRRAPGFLSGAFERII
jgi:hypothetical protein